MLKTADDVRKDLREIRFYYSMKALFDEAASTLKHTSLLEKVAKYNELVSEAPAQIYILYCALYIKGHTQAALADEWGYTREYVKDLNQKLVEYLQKTIT